MLAPKRFIYPCIALICWGISVSAQECPSYVTQALTTAGEACADLGRNQACYGFPSITAQLSDPQLRFETEGDIVPVNILERIEVAPPDFEVNTYGIAFLKVQANLPDTLPGQNVTILLFGDTAIERDATLETPTAELEARENVNVRAAPSTSARIVSSLKLGDKVIANGRLADNTWIRVFVPASGATGWVAANFLSGDTDALTEAQAGELAYRPMQAFYFRSGIGDAACADLPNSGLLIQTPKGAGEINLRINEVEFSIGSTIYLQASQSRGLAIHVFEGRVTVTSKGESVVVTDGFSVTVPLDENLSPVGPPDQPTPLSDDFFSAWDNEALQNMIQIAAPPNAPAVNNPAANNNIVAPGAGSQSPPQSPAGGGTSAANAPAGSCSINSDQAATMTFRNNSGRTVNVLWINFDCGEVLYQTLGPGQAYIQSTYLTHPWIVRDAASGAFIGGPYLPPGDVNIGD